MQGADRPVGQLLGEPPREIFAVAPDALVLDALQSLADHGVGAVLVLGGERLVGVFSERDYARRGELAGRSARQTRVRELMTPEVLAVDAQQTVEQCMAIMTAKRVRHLPVLEGERVVGLVSIGDLVKETISHYEEVARDIERNRLYTRIKEAGYY